MSLAALLDHLTHSQDQRHGRNVLYMQQQDNCLRALFPELLEDVDPLLPWADEVFGSRPEAVNLWIGGKDSVTTFHKDHYENMYAVIAGSKTFYLLPPCDSYRLSICEWPLAFYSPSQEPSDLGFAPLRLQKLQDAAPVKWSPADPRSLTSCRPKHLPKINPSDPPPLVAKVLPGEILYLPSLWHHFVEQDASPESACIAVNLWYDMAFDTKYAYFNLAEKLAKLYNDAS